MTKEVVIITHDDFDGSIDASTVSFGWQGIDYEIDLTEVHAKEFEEAIRPYLDRARQIEPAKGTKRTKSAPHTASARKPYAKVKARKAELARIRDWAASEGFQLKSARVPYEVHRAYNEMHPDDQIPLADGGPRHLDKRRVRPAAE